MADATRQKNVLEIKIEERIIEKEGEKKASQINNHIQKVIFKYFGTIKLLIKAAENMKADIRKYATEQEARANEVLLSDKLVP